MDGGFILATDTVVRRLEFVRLPEGWAAVGAVALLAAVLYGVGFLYLNERRAGATLRMRFVLASMRMLVVLLLAAIWLEPVLATYLHRRIESLTLVLMDASASMGLRDTYPDEADADRVRRAIAPLGEDDPRGLTRAELARAVLEGPEGALIRRLAEANPVEIHQFGERLTPVGRIHADGGGITTQDGGDTADGGGDPDAPRGGGTGREPPTGMRPGSVLPDVLLRADEGATDIGRAIREAVESQGGTPIAAVVVLSDGQFNRGEPVDAIARYARARKIPIHTIGVGDLSPPRNVAVAAVEAPPNVFVKDPFKVTAHLRTQGLGGVELTVELLERVRGVTTTPRVVDTRRVRVGPDGRTDPVEFSRSIAEAAEVDLIVRVPQQPGETLLDDNERETTVRALDHEMRVLLVAGGPSWEYRFLSRLLERDETVDVTCWLQTADEAAVRDGNTVIEAFPRDQEELFAYDAIILMDPQSGDFDPGWTAHVEALVGSYGGGLLYVAGRTNTPRFVRDPNTSGLIDLFPVVIDPSEAELLLNELGHFQSTGWPLSLPAAVVGHPVVALADQPGDNAAVWGGLPGVYWHYPVRRAKPVASVLLRHSHPRMRSAEGGHVLLATQYFGSGRTGFLAFDGTWRWRRAGDRYFNRFWLQLLRHMVEGKLVSGQHRGLLQVERERYAVGEAVMVEARLLDSRHLPLERPEVSAQVHRDGLAEGTVVLEAQPNRPGWYRGRFVPMRTGAYSLAVDLPGGDGVPAATIQTDVRVGQPDLEFRQVELDRESLELLAAQSAGGRYLEIDEVEELAALIPSRSAELILSGPPTSLWDRWWMLLVLGGLLGGEWALRKRARLL